MYQERILAYIDILGFSAAIKKTINKNEEVEAKTVNIFNILEDINEFKNKKYTGTSINSRVVSHFSDCAAISYLKEEKAGVFHILSDIIFLCYGVLQKGFLFRGAITCGKLYHKEKLFGPAMITAVDMEKNLAIYPRIVLDKEILVIAEEHPSEYPSKKEQLRVIKKLILKDFDGLYYLNYFDAINYIVGQEYGILSYFKPLRKNIIDLQKIAENDMSVKAKYLWLKNKYNTVLKKYITNYKNERTQNKYPDSYNYINGVDLIV